MLTSPQTTTRRRERKVSGPAGIIASRKAHLRREVLARVRDVDRREHDVADLHLRDAGLVVELRDA